MISEVTRILLKCIYNHTEFVVIGGGTIYRYSYTQSAKECEHHINQALYLQLFQS